jgi:hypothetical protein
LIRIGWGQPPFSRLLGAAQAIGFFRSPSS